MKAASEGLGLQSIALDLGLGLALRMHTDSSAAQGICARSGIGKVRHLAVSQLWIQERLREGTLTLHKVWGEMNPADLLTKHLDGAKISQFLQALALRPEAGRAGSAPRLATEVEAFLASLGSGVSPGGLAGPATAGVPSRPHAVPHATYACHARGIQAIFIEHPGDNGGAPTAAARPGQQGRADSAVSRPAGRQRSEGRSLDRELVRTSSSTPPATPEGIGRAEAGAWPAGSQCATPLRACGSFGVSVTSGGVCRIESQSHMPQVYSHTCVHECSADEFDSITTWLK